MLNVMDKEPQSKAPDKKFHTISDLRRAQVWFDDQVAMHKQPTGFMTSLTPELATVLVGRNPDNRKLRANRVADFANDIVNGDWKLNGEPVIVAKDGHLNDGQHRCMAVIEAQMSIPIMIVFGVERDTRDTLDQGTLRTAADYLEMLGADDAKHLAAAARALWQYRKFGYLHSTSQAMAPTRSEVKQTALENPGLSKSIQFVSRPGTRAFAARSMLAFCHFVFKGVAGDLAANYFMDAFIEGNDLKRGDPILYVRNRFIAEKGKLSTPDRVELLFRAWNAHRLGEDRQLLRTYGGVLPTPEA